MHTFQNSSELACWLRDRGVDLSCWGVGEAKTVEDLLGEIHAGEASLSSEGALRQIRAVSVIVCRGDVCLVEAEQELRPGEWRVRNRYPSEKIMPGETPAQAARRCLREELHVAAEDIVVRAVSGPESQVGQSLSYPGLCTEYLVYTVRVNATGIPDGEFTTSESPMVSGRQPRTHRWVWQSEPIEGQRELGRCVPHDD